MTQQKQEQVHAEKTANGQPQVQGLSRDAGIALDALIDEHVFGYEWFGVSSADLVPPTCTHRLGRPAGDGYYGHIRAERHEDGHVVPLGGREYSTKIATAWLVMEKMDAAHLHVEVASMVSGWRARVGACTATAPTPALAICRAALAAVGAA